MPQAVPRKHRLSNIVCMSQMVPRKYRLGGPLGSVLGRLRGDVGVLLGRVGASDVREGENADTFQKRKDINECCFLDPFFGGLLGLSLGRLGGLLGRLEAILGVLERSWDVLEASWIIFGAS